MLSCRHLMLAVSDVTKARAFYIDALGLEVVEEHPSMFAVRCGSVRFTVVGGGTPQPDDADVNPPITLMLATDDIEATVSHLRARGVKFLGEISEAPGFMRHIALTDPDNNVIYLAQYERDPILP
jgi:predicted enzyme related to lactoylglutathione lyase